MCDGISDTLCMVQKQDVNLRGGWFHEDGGGGHCKLVGW